MFETESRCSDDTSDQFIEGRIPTEGLSDKAAWDARRRIERLRELRRLRELLDDPEFNELE